MPMYDAFCQSLLPGNYALTKSMELTRVRDCGTLWYTKKFLTLYYFVFLSNDLMTTAYQTAVVEIFDRYIASLPEEQRDSAEVFFIPRTKRSISNLRVSIGLPTLPATMCLRIRRNAAPMIAAPESTILRCSWALADKRGSSAV